MDVTQKYKVTYQRHGCNTLDTDVTQKYKVNIRDMDVTQKIQGKYQRHGCNTKIQGKKLETWM